MQGQALAPADLADRESLLAPPLLRLVQRLGWAPPQAAISIAPPLSSLVSELMTSLARVEGASPCVSLARLELCPALGVRHEHGGLCGSAVMVPSWGLADRSG